MFIKKIVSMADVNVDNSRELNTDTTDCLTGACPTIYETDNGNLIIQGFVMNISDKKVLTLPQNEDAIIVPRALIDLLKK